MDSGLPTPVKWRMVGATSKMSISFRGPVPFIQEDHESSLGFVVW